MTPHVLDGGGSPSARRQTTADPSPPTVRLSIVMPAYDEDRTLERAVLSVLAQDYPCQIELVVVDDGSPTPAQELIGDIDDDRLIVHRHPTNLGKGAALRTGATLATGTHLVPFDADLEYSPADLPAMLEPVLAGRCDVVYGTRLFGANTMYQSYKHAIGNRLLTLAANVSFNAYLSDMHTCLKLMPLELFRSFPLSESGFGLDTEITARILKMGIRPFEVPVSYHSRSYEQGKKISWRDGVECLQVLARVRRASLRQVAPKASEPRAGRNTVIEGRFRRVDHETEQRRAAAL